MTVLAVQTLSAWCRNSQAGKTSSVVSGQESMTLVFSRLKNQVVSFATAKITEN
jgi:hypothetical protein